jgi:predicted DNA-binding transcriptional regulator AlpA
MDYTMATNALLEALRFTPAETAVKLGVSEATLANWRSQKKGPIALRIGRAVYYYADDLEAYLQEERNKAYADKKARAPVALPVLHRRARIRRFDGTTGHRRQPESRPALREDPTDIG